jgi:hypothetical protein
MRRQALLGGKRVSVSGCTHVGALLGVSLADVRTNVDAHTRTSTCLLYTCTDIYLYRYMYIYIYIHRSLARGCLCVQSQARIMCTGSVAKSLLMSARGHSESRQRARTRVCVAREFQKTAKRHKGLCSDEVTVTSERHAPAERAKKEERERGTHWGLRQRENFF